MNSLTTTEKPQPRRQVVGQDDNVGVKITAFVATDTDLPLRWKERDDGTCVLQFLTQAGWREVPIIVS